MSNYRLIVGLGNPGSDYTGTRHNIGFSFLDYLLFTEFGNNLKEAKSFFEGNLSFDTNWKAKFGALYKEIEFNSEKLILLKPSTYMNLSGEPLRQFCNYFKYEKDEFLVCYDDIDLSLGHLRIKDKGGSGGHNGIKSISSEFGSDEFARLKMGVSRPKIIKNSDLPDRDQQEAIIASGSVSNWVLGRFSKEEKEQLEDVFKRSLGICRTLLKSGFKNAQQRGKFKPKEISKDLKN